MRVGQLRLFSFTQMCSSFSSMIGFDLCWPWGKAWQNLKKSKCENVSMGDFVLEKDWWTSVGLLRNRRIKIQLQCLARAEACPSPSYAPLLECSFPVAHISKLKKKNKTVKMNFFHKIKLVNASPPETQSMMMQYWSLCFPVKRCLCFS